MLVIACAAVSCTKEGGSDVPKVKDPIEIVSPSPDKTISKVSLNAGQESYVKASNGFAINSLKSLYGQAEGNMVFSPLSLQYALAMTVNGASGETAEEILSVFGYGDNLQSLNGFCNLLLNQLPALDGKVTLKLTDAMIVSDSYTVREDFRNTLAGVYYAPVEYLDYSNPQKVTDRINEWAYRSTDGFIYPLIDKSDLSDNVVAIILNALYFKAPWQDSGMSPLFDPDITMDGCPFLYDGGGEGKADYMRCSHYFRYGRMEENGILEIPYAGGKYVMYVVLPDEKGGKGIDNLLSSISEESLSGAIALMTSEAEVNLRLPKFEIENKFNLNGMLSSLGIRRVFDASEAQLDRIFVGENAFIDKIIQKARINVTEWGTEAGAVTEVDLGPSSTPDEDIRTVDFYADHPFAFFIAEKSSGVILFEGIYAGK